MNRHTEPTIESKNFVSYVDQHIPAGKEAADIPLTTSPWKSLRFERLPAIDYEGQHYHYAALRMEVAGFTIEAFGLSCGPEGFEIGSPGDEVKISTGDEPIEVPRFINFFDSLVNSTN